MASIHPDLIALCVRFRIKPGRKEQFRRMLYDVVEAMKSEPEFVNTIAHEEPDHPDRMTLYETWRCTREAFMRDQMSKPYRADYEARLPEVLEDRAIEIWTPVAAWSGPGGLK